MRYRRARSGEASLYKARAERSGFLICIPSPAVLRRISSPLTGIDDDGIVGEGIAQGIISFRLVDSTGLPIPGAPVSSTARNGSSFRQMDQSTDSYGVAAAVPILGSQPDSTVYCRCRKSTDHFLGICATTSYRFGRRRCGWRQFRPHRTIRARLLHHDLRVRAGSDSSDYAESATLPLQIDQAHVTFDVPSAGISVPGHLVDVSPTQVNVQLPWELQGQSSVQMKVSVNYSDGNVISLPLADAAPSLFGDQGGMAAALNGLNQTVTSATPARQGQTLQLFANGLGPVNNQPRSGEPAPSSPLASTKSLPVVTIAGQNATVLFSGLAPGFAGLYQVNVTVPTGLTPGLQPVNVSIAGRTSKSLSVPVQ